jgi:hypothetical protein
MLVLAHFCGSQLTCLLNLFDLLVPQANVDILRFEISMDDLTSSMNIIKTNQTLSSQPPDKRKWHSTVVVPFNNFKEITSQDLKHHDEMLAVGSMVDE